MLGRNESLSLHATNFKRNMLNATSHPMHLGRKAVFMNHPVLKNFTKSCARMIHCELYTSAETVTLKTFAEKWSQVGFY